MAKGSPLLGAGPVVYLLTKVESRCGFVLHPHVTDIASGLYPRAEEEI